MPRLRVRPASPTISMAVLTTARAVIEDAATRKEAVKIQERLRLPAKDFARFDRRMDGFSTHIRQAGKDVEEAQTSARKISSRLEKIEKLELGEDESYGNSVFRAQLDSPGETQLPT